VPGRGNDRSRCAVGDFSVNFSEKNSIVCQGLLSNQLFCIVAPPARDAARYQNNIAAGALAASEKSEIWMDGPHLLAH
jgi:hypothetical protein